MFGLGFAASGDDAQPDSRKRRSGRNLSGLIIAVGQRWGVTEFKFVSEAPERPYHVNAAGGTLNPNVWPDRDPPRLVRRRRHASLDSLAI